MPREASSMARLARTSAARKSSVSPARALRRPMRIFWPGGAGMMSSPAARASLIIGLVSGLCIQRAPRSNGTSKVAVSVRQRPPIWLAASTTITLRLAAMIRRAAAMPAAPAPITTMSASRGSGAAAAACAERRCHGKGRGRRQEIAARHCHVMVSGSLEEQREHAGELAASHADAATVMVNQS